MHKKLNICTLLNKDKLLVCAKNNCDDWRR